ncbi:hypothetical protein [Kribbella sp. CA-247076]|uniref:hypothetical protein n=1 Tax=Kribbella sp. CA-247076 TaxID=3239941 RepID=UPI003D922E6B
MTAVALPGTTYDPRALLGVGVPAHVLVHLDDGWTPAWLIGRLHCANGWVALVQYVDPDGREQTCRLPADRVAVSPPTDRPQ